MEADREGTNLEQPVTISGIARLTGLLRRRAVVLPGVVCADASDHRE
jgi:hypothetical protein